MNRDELAIKLNQIYMQSYNISFDEGLQLDKSVEKRTEEIETHKSAILAEFDRLAAEVIRLTADRDSEKRWADEYHLHAEEMTAECVRLTAELTKAKHDLDAYSNDLVNEI